MDTTAAFLPLDGAIQFGNVEMRVASMPSFGAESLTIRLLDSSLELHNLGDLGFTATNEKIFSADDKFFCGHDNSNRTDEFRQIYDALRHAPRTQSTDALDNDAGRSD